MEQTNTFFTDLEQVNPVSKKANGVIKLDTYPKHDAWGLAMNVVTYPVHILPLYFQKDEFILAKGNTNSNRDVQHFGVVVDRNRDGNLQTIATVTDSYHTMDASTVYRDLMVDLNDAGVSASPERVYVSGNGGRQLLTVKLDELSTPMLSVGKFTMSINLSTSVDGSLKHAISLNPVDENNRAIFGFQSDFSFSSKHTKNLKERHVAFSTVIEKMLSEWNEVIAPMMVLMDGEKFDSNVALELTRDILETSNIPEKHTSRMMANIDGYKKEHSALSVLCDITAYVDDTLAENRPERVEQFRKSINKTAMKVINKKLGVL